MILVMPMAGLGTRFEKFGYTTPKPIIDILGRPMFFYALNSVKGLVFTEVLFIVLKEHEEKYTMSEIIRRNVDFNYRIIILERPLEGQLCSVMASRDYVKCDDSLMIISCDTYVEHNWLVNSFDLNLDGWISVCKMPGDQWSFAKVDDHDLVVEVAEKKRISDFASTGVYFFSKAEYFFNEADAMLNNAEKIKNEYYIIPVYNRLIRNGYKIGVQKANSMWDMGTPQAKILFEKHFGSV